MEALAGDDQHPAIAATTRTSVASSTPPTATSPTMYLQDDAGLHRRARRWHRRAGRRHRRWATRSARPGRLRLPGREAAVQAVFAQEPGVRARPRAVGADARTSRSRTSARPSRTSSRRRSRPRTAPADRRGQRQALARRGDASLAGQRRRVRVARDRGVPRRPALRPVRASTSTTSAARSSASSRATRSRSGSRRGGKSSTPFTFTAARWAAATACSCCRAEDYTGDVARSPRRHRPALPDDYPTR